MKLYHGSYTYIEVIPLQKSAHYTQNIFRQ